MRDLVESENSVAAWHTGYERIGARHHREFRFDEQAIVINDAVEMKESSSCRAYLHFHPDVDVAIENGAISADGTSITFAGATEVKLDDYLYAPRFNTLIPARKVTVTFEKSLTTSIILG